MAIIPATYETDEAQLRQLLTDFDTIILMKVGRVLPQIIAALTDMKLLESALYAERIGMPEEKVLHGVDISQLQNKLFHNLDKYLLSWEQTISLARKSYLAIYGVSRLTRSYTAKNWNSIKCLLFLIMVIVYNKKCAKLNS